MEIFTEQYGNSNFSATIESSLNTVGCTVDARGVDVIKLLWEELDSAPFTGTWLSQVEDVLQDLKSIVFNACFMDWCIANYAKDYNPVAKYSYLENNLFNNPTLLTNSINLANGTFNIQNQSVDSWSAHYREFLIPSGTEKIRITVNATKSWTSTVENSGQLFAYFPGSAGDGSLIAGWQVDGNNLTYDQELYTGWGAQKVCIGIAGLKNGIDYNLTVQTVGQDSPVTLEVNTSAHSASLTAGDEDWYKFQTSTSGAYVIETHGSTDTYIILYQSNQTTVIENDDDSGSGTCSKITRTLSASTWYYVKVRGYNSSTTGSYTIDVSGGGSTTLNPPRNLTATAGDTEATLNWSAPSSGTPSSYKVYYSLTRKWNLYRP